MIENKYIVGSQGENIIIGLPIKAARMTKREALELAAWLVTLAEKESGEFEKILKELHES